MKAITPEDAGTSQQVSTTTGKSQISNLGKRLTALRGGSTGISIQGFTASYGGETIPLDKFQPLLDQAIRGGAAGDEETTFFNGRLGIFVNGQFNFGDKDSDEDVNGYKFDTKGITGGMDYWFTDNLVLGLAFGYAKTSVTYDGDGDMDLNSYLFSLYGNYYIWKGLYLEGLVGFGVNNYKSSRTIDYTITEKIKRDMEASYSGTQGLFNLGLGYDYDISGFTLGAFGRVSWMPYFIDSYTESSTSGEQSQHGPGHGFRQPGIPLSNHHSGNQCGLQPEYQKIA